MRRARTSTLRNPNSTKGIPSVMLRDKDLPAHRVQNARQCYGVCPAARSATAFPTPPQFTQIGGPPQRPN
eukprot:scaffold61817_cov60-Phaeocystis_antarctica.AAC.1